MSLPKLVNIRSKFKEYNLLGKNNVIKSNVRNKDNNVFCI